MRWRSDDERCAACILACPQHALWFDAAGAWRVDPGSCDGCGACASACPSQAIDPPGVRTAELERLPRAGASITLRCRRHHDDGVAPCLAAVHPEALATLMLRARERTIHVDLAACERCPSGALRPVIEAHLERARAFACTAGGEPRIELQRPAPPDAASAPALSRRDLFGRVRTHAEALVGDALAHGSGARDARLPHRAALLRAARERDRPGDAPPPTCDVLGAFFVAWDLGDTCDGCHAHGGPRCARVCPNRAWRLERGEGEATLMHDPASCSGCGACQRSCPRSALTARPAPVTADGGARAARSVPLARCRGCRRSASVGADGLCPHCAKRARLVASTG